MMQPQGSVVNPRRRTKSPMMILSAPILEQILCPHLRADFNNDRRDRFEQRSVFFGFFGAANQLVGYGTAGRAFLQSGESLEIGGSLERCQPPRGKESPSEQEVREE